MELYIGNATRQIVRFQWRTLETQQLREQPIQPGTQVKLAGNYTTPEIDYIVRQHARYGLIAASDIDRTKQFHGLCYSIDKPITQAKLVYLFNANVSDLVKQGQATRRANAIAQAKMIEDALTQNGRSEQMLGLDLSVQQENEDPNNDIAPVSEGTYVVPRGQGPARAGKPRARAA